MTFIEAVTNVVNNGDGMRLPGWEASLYLTTFEWPVGTPLAGQVRWVWRGPSLPDFVYYDENGDQQVLAGTQFATIMPSAADILLNTWETASL